MMHNNVGTCMCVHAEAYEAWAYKEGREHSRERAIIFAASDDGGKTEELVQAKRRSQRRPTGGVVDAESPVDALNDVAIADTQRLVRGLCTCRCQGGTTKYANICVPLVGLKGNE